MKSTLFIISFFCVVIGIIFILFYISGQNKNPQFSISPNSWDFGKVEEGQVLKHTFIIENKGNAEMVVQAYPICRECISVKLSKNNIPLHKKAEMFVTFFTKNKNGKSESSVMIQTNDPNNRVKKIDVEVFVIAKHSIVKI